MSKRRFVARPDKTHGVVQRDITQAYELDMMRKYGHSWKKVLRRKLQEEEAARQARLDSPQPEDLPEPTVSIESEDS